MTIHRFYIPTIFSYQSSETDQPTTGKLGADNRQLKTDNWYITFPPEISHQMTKVLRLKGGDEVIVFNGSGKEWKVAISSLSLSKGRNEMQGKIIEERVNQADPKTHITLYQSLIPRDKFEEVLQKSTEVGAFGFVPIQTARSIVHTKDVDEKKLLRWQKIVQEAAEQSERGIVPSVAPAQKFETAIDEAVLQGTVLIAWEEETANTLKHNLSFITHPLSLFIGPEGGFTPEEVDYATKKGVIPITLGPRILRSETAGPVTIAQLLLLLE